MCCKGSQNQFNNVVTFMIAGDRIRPLVTYRTSLKLVGYCIKREPLLVQRDPVLVTNVEPAHEDDVLVDHGLLSYLIGLSATRCAAPVPSTPLYLVERESLRCWT